MRAVIEELHRELPREFEGSLEEQARAVLALIIDLAVQPPSSQPCIVDPSLCPNCGAPSTSPTSPYCSSFCREESAFVRQMRRGLEDETLLSPERQVFLAHSLWHVLGGGYPHRLPLIPENAKKQAMKRSDGRCEVCQNPASTFDHKGSG